MKVQILAPAMKDTEETQFHAEPLSSYGQESLGGGGEEDVVYDLFVIEGNRGDLLGKGEDHVEILGGQQFGAAILQPLFARDALAFGAVAVAAGTVANVSELAVVAPFDGAAQGGSPTGFDGLHEAVLMQGQGVGLPVRRAVSSKDVGQLQGWLGQGLLPAIAFANVGVHIVQGTDGGGYNLRANASVTRSGVDTAMAEQDLDDAEIGAVLQQVCGEGVA